MAVTYEDIRHRALTPLIYAHLNPYGTLELNLKTRMPIEAAVCKLAVITATRSLQLLHGGQVFKALIML